jgi:hypothetical protein
MMIAKEKLDSNGKYTAITDALSTHHKGLEDSQAPGSRTVRNM